MEGALPRAVLIDARGAWPGDLSKIGERETPHGTRAVAGSFIPPRGDARRKRYNPRLT